MERSKLLAGLKKLLLKFSVTVSYLDLFENTRLRQLMRLLLVSSSSKLAIIHPVGMLPYHSSNPGTTSEQCVLMCVEILYYIQYHQPCAAHAAHRTKQSGTKRALVQSQAPGGGLRKRTHGGSPAKGGTKKYRDASKAQTLQKQGQGLEGTTRVASCYIYMVLLLLLLLVWLFSSKHLGLGVE